jgi:predicted O-methyltransferase YrrM
MIKSIIKQVLHVYGYTLVKSDDLRLQSEVLLKNLENILQGYESQFIKIRGGQPLPLDKLRHKIMMRLLGTPPTEAFYLLDALNRTRAIPGDVCEFGVAQGETSSLIANEIRNGRKKLFLYDSFQGLPKPSEMDQLKDDIFNLGSIGAYAGTMSCSEEMVIERLMAVGFESSRTVIHKGFVEPDFESLGHLPDKISCAYVDFDFYQPILIVLEALHTRLSQGAIVVVDDYDFFSTGAKTAVDEFVLRHPEYGLEIPGKELGCFCVLSKPA